MLSPSPNKFRILLGKTDRHFELSAQPPLPSGILQALINKGLKPEVRDYPECDSQAYVIARNQISWPGNDPEASFLHLAELIAKHADRLDGFDKRMHELEPGVEASMFDLEARGRLPR